MTSTIRVFKGIDNFIDIIVNDEEQQPLTINNNSFKFKVRDRDSTLLIDKQLEFVEGYTNRLALDLLSTDLEDINIGIYTWGIAMTDEDQRIRPLYLEINGDVDGAFHVINTPIS